LTKAEMGEVFRAEFWFAKTGAGWCGAWRGVGMREGTLSSDDGSGAEMAVPKAEKEDGVNGSGRRRLGARGWPCGGRVGGAMAVKREELLSFGAFSKIGHENQVPWSSQKLA